MQVFLQLLEPVMEQWTGCSKRSTSRLYIVTLLIYLTYMQSISCEMLGWMRHKLESRLPGEIPITSDMQMTATLWQKQRGTEEPLDESESGSVVSNSLQPHGLYSPWNSPGQNTGVGSSCLIMTLLFSQYELFLKFIFNWRIIAL